jgi:hypothetical protein
MDIRMLLVSLFLATPSFGWFAENINRHGRTFVYQPVDRWFYEYRCRPGVVPATDMDLAGCTPGHDGVSLETFQKNLRRESEPLKRKIESQIEGKREEIRRHEDRITYLKGVLASTARGSATFVEYTARLSDETAALESAQTIVKKLREPLEGLEELFKGRMLTERLIHPIRKEKSDYANVRPWIKFFDHVFAQADGGKYGTNSWWDLEWRRVWWTDFRAPGSCPNGYEMLTRETPGVYSLGGHLLRFGRAIQYGETGFDSRSFWHSFWGGRVSSDDNPDKVDAMAVSRGWPSPPGEGPPFWNLGIGIRSLPPEVWERDEKRDAVWVSVSIDHDARALPVLCVARVP